MNVQQIINIEDEEIVIEALKEMKRPFLTRVNQIPVVHTITNQISSVYTKTKNSNGYVKYSAESIESVVRKGKPLVELLSPLDRFACDQLDKIEVGKMVGNVGVSFGLLRDESVKALKYCLEYIQYCVSQVHHQMKLLQHSIQSRFSSATTVSVSNEPSTLENMNLLIQNVKKEIVETLKRVVDMLGTYSSSYLPLDAKQSVRSFILNLPSRLSTIRQGPIDSQQEAQNVLMLASESASMLQNIESVISDTVYSAEQALRKDTSAPVDDMVVEMEKME